MSDKKTALILFLVFLAAYFIPFSRTTVQNAVLESLLMLQEYARQHVLLCLIPAFFIAGAIAVFVSKDSVIKYLGPKANKILSYGVASVSGTVLAVCSCTVLPLFAGIYTRGAGIGPATAFLYSGPAINVLAIILTGKVLGWQIGLARAVGAVVFSVVIGLLMQAFFGRKGRDDRDESGFVTDHGAKEDRPLWKTAIYFAVMIGILVFINWGRSDPSLAVWYWIYRAKWVIGGLLAIGLAGMILRWFKKDELKEWTSSTWGFAKQIFPLLFGGVLVAGFLLGRPGHEGIVPSDWVARLVGGNGLSANLFASVAGAFMYFATLTEVPILQGLLGSGMGQGPALALLLAGPALSLPSMLVIRSVLGTKKTVVYIVLVVIMATMTGMIYGALAGS
ncbi:MAG: permease [Candidatus Aminicenantes bacterium]|nr:permease [Candidatus Aminicenantes bacterium]